MAQDHKEAGAYSGVTGTWLDCISLCPLLSLALELLILAHVLFGHHSILQGSSCIACDIVKSLIAWEPYKQVVVENCMPEGQLARVTTAELAS